MRRETRNALVGLVLSAFGTAAGLWLAATGQLGFYIHPRYNLFTTIMFAIAAVMTIAGFGVVAARGAHGHDHGGSGRAPAWSLVTGGALVLVSAAALLVIPPASLTSQTASSRAMNSSLATFMKTGEAVDPESAKERFETFTVRDWAALLASQTDPDFYEGMDPTMTGFVTASGQDDVFYLSRFVVTCCAVDAQPVGVPVYLPGWQERYAEDTWLEVTGGIQQAETLGAQALVFAPIDVTEIDPPKDPYVY